MLYPEWGVELDPVGKGRHWMTFDGLRPSFSHTGQPRLQPHGVWLGGCKAVVRNVQWEGGQAVGLQKDSKSIISCTHVFMRRGKNVDWYFLIK